MKSSAVSLMLQNAVGGLKDAVRDAADQASDAVERGTRYVRDNYPEAKRMFDGGSRTIRGQVQESPILAMLIAGAVGYGLSYLHAGGHENQYRVRFR